MGHTFSATYDRVLKATGCADREDLAKKLSIRQSFITDCRRRGEFTPEVLLALVEQCGLNPHWVRTGEGEKYSFRSKAEHALTSSVSSEENGDANGVFIFLTSWDRFNYTFGIERARTIKEHEHFIKIIEVDYDCTAYEILNICYGINDNFISEHIGELPSFILPLNETANYDKCINNNLSVIGHIKYCLQFTLTASKRGLSQKEIDNIRNESIGNFRLIRPISF